VRSPLQAKWRSRQDVGVFAWESVEVGARHDTVSFYDAALARLVAVLKQETIHGSSLTPHGRG
jgi:hypothetical protein